MIGNLERTGQIPSTLCMLLCKTRCNCCEFPSEEHFQLLASVFSLTLDLECTATGFLITRPSLMSLRMFCLELAFAISLISLGSSQTLLRPHFITEAASRFCSLSDDILAD